MKKNSSNDEKCGARSDADVPRDTAVEDRHDGGSRGRPSSAAEVKTEAGSGGVRGDGRPVMWKHDGEEGGGGGDDGYGEDDNVGPMEAPKGWEDVEW